MAELLSSKLYFPCSMLSNKRHVMAVTTHKSIRMVAFDNVIEALDAMDMVRKRELRHIVGPKLIYNIPKLDDNAENDAWEASAIDVASYGINEFVLDICSFEKESASIQVNNSFSIVLQEVDSRIVLENLNRSWDT